MAAPRVIDVDGHFDEPDSAWDRFLDPAWRDMAPRFAVDSQGRPRIWVGGRMRPYIPMPPGPRLDQIPGAYDPRARLADMDREGIDVMTMYPTKGLFFFGVERLEVAVALCRAYNDWAHDFCSVAPSRLLAPAILPQQDPSACLAEARRAIGELGMRGALLRPNPVGRRSLDDPAFAPLWSFLERADVPLVLHEGTTQDVPQLGSDRSENFLFRHMMSHPFEQQLALLALICGGVLERHLGLRVLLVEAGVGWVPWWLERMDHHAEKWGFASLPLPRPPSDYFRRQCYVAADAEETLLPLVVAAIGDDNLCFSTDYPHPDHAFEGVVAELADR
jgi:predicted TIM-barrel fold metal-dependent hydrolase